MRERYRRDLAAPAPDANPSYRENLRVRYALRAKITALMEHHHVDALVYPHETKPARTLAEEVPDGGATSGPSDKRGVGKGNTISSATGLPAIVVPAGANPDGLGVGLEFLGRLFDEPTIIRLAYAFEQAAPHRKLPPSTPLLGIERIDY